MDKNTKYILIAVVLLLVIGGAYYYYHNSSNNSNVEEYTPFDVSLGDQYTSPEEKECAPHFADLVNAGDHAPIVNEDYASKLAKMNRQCDSVRLPRTSKGVTPYNIDIADPKSFMFQVNLPRVILKDPQYQYGDPFRGDIPIKDHPNTCLVSKSRYNEHSSLRTDGLFSPYFNEMYDQYTGAEYKNMPINVVNEETIMDF